MTTPPDPYIAQAAEQRRIDFDKIKVVQPGWAEGVSPQPSVRPKGNAGQAED